MSLSKLRMTESNVIVEMSQGRRWPKASMTPVLTPWLCSLAAALRSRRGRGPERSWSKSGMAQEGVARVGVSQRGVARPLWEAGILLVHRWGSYETLNPAPFLPARLASSRLIWRPHSLNSNRCCCNIYSRFGSLKGKEKMNTSINVLIFVLCTKRSFFKPWGVTILCVFYRYYRCFGRAAL